MKKYVLSIDQGTTSTRAILFDTKAQVVAMSQMELQLFSPKNGWAEQNPNEIWETVFSVIEEVINSSHVEADEIAAIGITNQRETTILWDKRTGKPVYNAIVWQSRQSQDICEAMIANGHSELIKQRTGLVINPYFSGSKIKWIFDNVKGVYEKALKGDILFGTVDTYLLWKLTNGTVHATDYSNASRTMIFNIHTLTWDQEILDILGIPSCILPEVKPSSYPYGIAQKCYEIDEALEIPITALIGDQQASLFGQCCFDSGDIKNTYGTGCFMLMNTRNKIVHSQSGLLTTIAWGLDNKVEYALEGSVFIAGSAVKWLRDGLRLFEQSKDCERYSDRIKGSNGVYMVPAFVGLGTPYWDNDARGAIFGLSANTKKEHFVNATVESIAYQSKDVMEVMVKESGIHIRSLAVDGGASCNNYLMQFQSDILDCKIVRSECVETTALGAAYLAGLGVKLWKNTNELRKMHNVNQIFMSNMDDETRKKLYHGWMKAVEATRVFKL